MSRSLGNAGFLADEAATVERKVHQMYTDPTRIHAIDPGHVLGNPVFIYHEAFNPDKDEVEELKRVYRAGTVGDVEVKKRLTKALNDFLDPIRGNRQRLASQPQVVDDILVQGSNVARAEAQKTLALARGGWGWAIISCDARDVAQPGADVGTD